MNKLKQRSREAVEGKGGRFGLVLLAAIACIGAYGIAGAFEIPTGSDDVELRWDNTLRYTYGYRTSGQNQAIINSPNLDDGDRNFGVGTVTNRLDLLSEADLVYKKDYGIRFSGALWYDQRYKDSLDNSSAATSNHLSNGTQTPGFSSYTDRYYAGPSGELQDAFVFGKFTLEDIPFNIKAGRHTVYWGESMLSNGGTHGIAYGQSAIDINKGLAQPSVEMKELFRPRNQISLQTQPTSKLSIAAQYYLQWEANRVPEPGTYLSFADMLGNGSESLVAGPPFHPYAGNAGDINPRQAGDWGISARYSPDWLDGTVGLYYRKFSDVNGQLNMRVGMTPTPGPPGSFAGPVPIEYRWSYASGIDLYGISLSKQIAGISFGSELSYRRNMPLWSAANTIVTSVPGPAGSKIDIPYSPYPDSGDTGGARGDTWHALINSLYLFGRTPLFDKATGLAEFTWNRLDRVTERADLFKWGSGFADNDRATKDYIGGQINFEPVWFQVVSGVDLSMPLSVAMGLVGNSCVTAGGTKNAGTYSVGFTADFFQKYKANLSYIGFFGPLDNDPVTGDVTTGNGPFVANKDRNMVTLTLKASF